jgi:hypothetical protein
VILFGGQRKVYQFNSGVERCRSTFYVCSSVHEGSRGRPPFSLSPSGRLSSGTRKKERRPACGDIAAVGRADGTPEKEEKEAGQASDRLLHTSRTRSTACPPARPPAAWPACCCLLLSAHPFAFQLMVVTIEDRAKAVVASCAKRG